MEYVITIEKRTMGRPASTRYFSEVREQKSGRLVARSWLYESQIMATKFASDWIAEQVKKD